MNETKAENEPRKTKTDWTTKGYRLDVIAWPESLMLTCETTCISTSGAGEGFPWMLGRVVIVPGTLRPDAERFAAHAFGVYDDAELVAAARDEVSKYFAGLKAPTVKGPSIPPVGAGAAN